MFSPGLSRHRGGHSRPRIRTALRGKTGTSNDYADAWFVGFTPQITCCVWVGVDERRSMGAGMTGAQAAVPIFARSMIALHKKLPVENFEKLDSVFMGKVCPRRTSRR